MKTLIPAYGRNPKTKLDALQDYYDGKDWILCDCTSIYHGKYCSSRDFIDEQVLLRYHDNLRMVYVTFDGGK